MEKFISELTSEIFTENNFSAEGMPNNELIEYGLDEITASLDTESINNAINKYNENKESNLKIDIGEVRSFIENPERTVNISVDDVGVKKLMTL